MEFFGEEKNLFSLAGFETRTVHPVTWSKHRLGYPGSEYNFCSYRNTSTSLLSLIGFEYGTH